MPHSETTVGTFPGDLVLRGELAEGLADLRRHPEDLDDVFRALLDDSSASAYGQAEADAARRWYLNTDVPVRLADSPEPPTATCLTVQVGESREEDVTLADVHYRPSLPDDRTWLALTAPFDPAFDPGTRRLTLPAGVTLVTVPGMFVVTRDGQAVEVRAAQGRELTLAPLPTPLDLLGCVLKGARPDGARQIGSVVEQETYTVGVHVVGEPVFLAWLFAISKYVLYQIRERLESRGLEQVRYANSDVIASGGPENGWSRFLTITGKARQTWVQRRGGRIWSVEREVLVEQGGVTVDLDRDVLGG